MPKFGYAVFAGYFTACLLEFERNIIRYCLWLWADEPGIFYRVNPWKDPLIHLLMLGCCGIILGLFLGFLWGIFSVGRDIQVSLFKLFLFAVIAMALIGGLHDYYVINKEALLINLSLALFIPEFLVIFSTIGYGLWLRRKGKTL